MTTDKVKQSENGADAREDQHLRIMVERLLREGRSEHEITVAVETASAESRDHHEL